MWSEGNLCGVRVCVHGEGMCVWMMDNGVCGGQTWLPMLSAYVNELISHSSVMHLS